MFIIIIIVSKIKCRKDPRLSNSVGHINVGKKGTRSKRTKVCKSSKTVWKSKFMARPAKHVLKVGNILYFLHSCSR